MTDADFAAVVAERRSEWIKGAAALCRSIDWHSVSNGETIHVVDASALPPEATKQALAWTAGGSDRILRPYLKDRRRGPVLVVDAGGVARARLAADQLTADEAYALGRLEVAQVALHELGHARVAEAAGAAIPTTATLALLMAAAATPTPDSNWRRSHGRDWCRAYCHLSDRAARSLWPRSWWLDACQHDLRLHGHGNADELQAALQPELGTDEPLADILRRDPPAAYRELFPDEIPQHERLPYGHP